MTMSNARHPRYWAMIGVLCLGLVTATALMVILIPVRPVHGLECEPISFREAVEFADAIFEGKALSRNAGDPESLPFEMVTEFKVFNVAKGDVPPIATVRGDSWAPEYRVGHTYMVFATEWTEADNSDLLTHGISPRPIGFRVGGCLNSSMFDIHKGIVDEAGARIAARVTLATLIALTGIAGVISWRMRRRHQGRHYPESPPDMSD